MDNNILYTDICCPEMVEIIKDELGLDVVQRFKKEHWSVIEAMSFITAPNLVLSVVNTIDEISVMEISLLTFMCKPILVTASSISSYPVIERTVDYVDKNANLKDENSNFISWYRAVVEGQWTREDCPQTQIERFSG